MQFSAIPGLDDVKQQLVQAVQSGHVAHAQLFSGKEGGANLMLAIAYSTFVNCTNRQAADSCGQCSSCTKMAKFIHPDLHFIFPTTTNKKFKKREDAFSQVFMKEWRSFLAQYPYGSVNQWITLLGGDNKSGMIPKQESRNIIKALSMKAFEAAYKVMLIWLPELMHPAAANAILKILEEPAPNTLFLLVTNKPEDLLVTITSRTQVVMVRGFSDEEIQQHLQTREVAPDRALQIAHICDGNMQMALDLANDAPDDNASLFQAWMRTCFKMDYMQLDAASSDFGKMGKEAQKSLLQYALSMFREVLLANFADPSLMRLKEEQKTFVENFAKVVNVGSLEGLVHTMDQAIFHLNRNANPKITFFYISIKVGNLLRSK